MSETVIEIMGYTSAIAATIGIIRWKAIDRSYFPFVFLLIITTIHALITSLMTRWGYPNTINLNIYGLLSSLVILWFFKQQQLFTNGRIISTIIYCLAGFWLCENVYVFSIHRLNTYFSIVSSVLIISLSIPMISRLFINESRSFDRNATFLISIGLLIVYTLQLIVALFLVNGFDEQAPFLKASGQIMASVNFVINLLYVFAVLCIPRKQASLLF